MNDLAPPGGYPQAARNAVARRVARRFRPRSYARGYAYGKLLLDPAYRAIAAALDSVPLPLLDVGCGMGLLGMYLHELGLCHDYLGIDIDSRKLQVGNDALAGAPALLRLREADASALPRHCGHVVLMDVLHYLPFETQSRLLQQAAERVAPRGTLLVRTCVADRSLRFKATLAEEWLLHATGWMRRDGTRYIPRHDQIEATFENLGFHVASSPLWGMTPFNSHLFIARRQPLESTP